MCLVYNNKYYENVLLPVQTLSVPVTVTNTGSTSIELISYIAEYDLSGCLVNLTQSETIAVTANDIAQVTLSKNFSADTTGTAKVFLWEKDNIRPVSDSIYVTVGDNISDSNYTYLKTVSVTETATNTTVTCTDTASLMASNSNVTKTLTFTPQTFVGSYNNQELTLNFNSNVLSESVTAQNLYAADYNDDLLTFIATADNNKIVLQPDNDTNNFVSDSIYHLTVTNSILSKGGNALSDTLQIPIYILDRYCSWRNFDTY